METLGLHIIGLGITALPLAGMFREAYRDWRFEQEHQEKSDWIVEIETS